jgi:Na+-driven multidrug efflux pump
VFSLKKSNQTMLQGPLFGSIVSYTVPIILTGILQLLFNAADLVVVGRFCGSVSVAAVGATGAITNLIVNLFIGLSVGAGVTVAQALGAKEDETVHRTVHTALPAVWTVR